MFHDLQDLQIRSTSTSTDSAASKCPPQRPKGAQRQPKAADDVDNEAVFFGSLSYTVIPFSTQLAGD